MKATAVWMEPKEESKSHWGNLEVCETPSYTVEIKVPSNYDEDLYGRFIHSKIVSYKESCVNIQTLNTKFLRVEDAEGGFRSCKNNAKLPNYPMLIVITSTNKQALEKTRDYLVSLLNRCYISGNVASAKVSLEPSTFKNLQALRSKLGAEFMCDIHCSGKSANSVQVTVLTQKTGAGQEVLEQVLARLASYKSEKPQNPKNPKKTPVESKPQEDS